MSLVDAVRQRAAEMFNEELPDWAAAAAIRVVEAYLSEVIDQRRVRVITRIENNYIFLPTMKVSEIHSIVLHPHGIALDNYTYLAAGIIHFPTLPMHGHYVVVEFTGGYTESDIPQNLLTALAVVAYNIAKIEPNLAKISGEVTLEFINRVITPQVEDLLRGV